jgi:hypothetical protein
MLITTALITTALVTTALVTTTLVTTTLVAAALVATVTIVPVLVAAAPTLVPPIAAPSRSHAVPVPPAAVIVAPRLIIVRVITRSDGSLDAHAGHCAGIQQSHGNTHESDRHPTLTHQVHFGSTALSLSVHSISPNGAPAGSATTATSPP